MGLHRQTFREARRAVHRSLVRLAIIVALSTWTLSAAVAAAQGEYAITAPIESYGDTGAECCDRLHATAQGVLDGYIWSACSAEGASNVRGSARFSGSSYCTPVENPPGQWGWRFACHQSVEGMCRPPPPSGERTPPGEGDSGGSGGAGFVSPYMRSGEEPGGGSTPAESAPSASDGGASSSVPAPSPSSGGSSSGGSSSGGSAGGSVAASPGATGWVGPAPIPGAEMQFDREAWQAQQRAAATQQLVADQSRAVETMVAGLSATAMQSASTDIGEGVRQFEIEILVPAGMLYDDFFISFGAGVRGWIWLTEATPENTPFGIEIAGAGGWGIGAFQGAQMVRLVGEVRAWLGPIFVGAVADYRHHIVRDLITLGPTVGAGWQTASRQLWMTAGLRWMPAVDGLLDNIGGVASLGVNLFLCSIEAMYTRQQLGPSGAMLMANLGVRLPF